MRITTLIENRAADRDPRLTAEWGLSLHIACGGGRILLDTGASGAFVKNAALLGVDLGTVDAAVLSHHHYDHGGGLRRFFEVNTTARVHLAKPPQGVCWARRFRVLRRCIGIDPAIFEQHHGRFATVREATEILPGVFLFPDIHGPHARPGGNRILFLKNSGGFRRDDFRHEIAVAVRENGTLVVFTGCSHNGVLNILDTVRAALPGVPVRAVVGGFHMVSKPPFNTAADRSRAVAAVGRAMLDYPVELAWTGHCTGNKAYATLKRVMGDRLNILRTGTVIDI